MLHSLEQLSDELALDLIEGRVVVLRSLPGTGASSVATHVSEVLRPTAMLIRGRDLGEDGAAAIRQIQEHIRLHVESAGAAQVIIDDFGHVMRRPFGHAFQGGLRAVVVDGENAGAVGCLLTSRLGDALKIDGARGSPLVAVAHFRFPPWYVPEDYEGAAEQTGWSVEAIAAFAGSNPSVLDRLIRGGPLAAGAYCAEQVRRWLAQLDETDSRRLSELIRAPQPYISSDDRLTGLLNRTQDGVALLGVLDADAIDREILGPWPSNRVDSARRFQIRIGDEPNPLWVDRYIGTDAALLVAYLDVLAGTVGPRRFRILTTYLGVKNLTPAERAQLELGLARWRAKGFEVDLRVAARDDVILLHARELVLPGSRSCITLPPIDRILGVAPLGNEAEARPNAPDVALPEDAWRRATPL